MFLKAWNTLFTQESGINLALCLLIFRVFSKDYVIIQGSNFFKMFFGLHLFMAFLRNSGLISWDMFIPESGIPTRNT